MGPILFGLHEFGMQLYIVAGHQIQMLDLLFMLVSLGLHWFGVVTLVITGGVTRRAL
jgi:hypothetical protein